MCIRDRFNAIDTLIGPFDYDYRSDEISENGLKTGDLVQDLSLIHISEPTRPY